MKGNRILIVLIISCFFFLQNCSQRTVEPLAIIGRDPQSSNSSSIVIKKLPPTIVKSNSIVNHIKDSLKRKLVDSLTNLPSKIVVKTQIVSSPKNKLDSILVDSLRSCNKILQDSITSLKKPIITKIEGVDQREDTLFVNAKAQATILALQQENKKLKGEKHVYFKLVPLYKYPPLSKSTFLWGILGTIIFTLIVSFFVNKYIISKHIKTS